MKKKLRKPAIVLPKRTVTIFRRGTTGCIPDTRWTNRLRAEGRDFAKWLNQEGTMQDLFRPLVKLTAAVTKHELKRKRYTDALDPSDPYLSHEAKINELLGSIEKKYPSQLKLVSWADERGFPLFARQPIRPEGLEPGDAVAALEEFYGLTGDGVFASFERCALPTCDKYFFAFPRQKRHCSDACQRTNYDQSPGRKKKNKTYQRNHYRKFRSAAAVKRQQKLAARRAQDA